MINISLKKGDCLEEMKNIKDGSVDLILCDLPYCTTANKWDIIIDLTQLWGQYNRIIKENGAIILFGSQPFTTKLIMSNIKMFKYQLIWIKTKKVGHLNSKKQPMRQYEDINIFYKKQPIYHDQNIYDIEDKVRVGRNNGSNYNKSEKTTIQKKSGYSTNILNFKSVSKNLHPTQKPVELLEYLIKTYTNKNSLVLDNCMGVGSTGIACINTDRNFIGIELNEDYFKIAENRINNCLNN